MVIIDGAAGLPLPEREGKTCLELAHAPELDAMAKEGTLGLARTVPPGMEPSSACACMSVLGYDPKLYYRGRSAIEARSMGIPINGDEVAFRCNLVSVRDGRMLDYSAGHISTDEARRLIDSLNKSIGNENVKFFPGVSYRHICKIRGREDTLQATCTPPHDIPNQSVAKYMPGGQGSEVLRELMERSKDVLREHPVNAERLARGDKPATMIWLFWGCGQIPEMPPFKQTYGLNAAVTSGVDLLRGLALMAKMDVLEIPGVTDGLNNDYAAQAKGALEALENHDLVVIHVEAPDEAGHGGNVDAKLEAIERVDKEILGRFRTWREDSLRLLVMPDHPTPIKVQTHTSDPVPFLLWGTGFKSNQAVKFTEKEAKNTGLFMEDGYKIMRKLVKGKS